MRSNKTFNLALSALFIAFITIGILFVRVPIPFTQGYVHIGDAMIFLGILVLGWKKGAVVAAIGGLLGDIIGGFAMWAPWTFGIKGIMAMIVGAIVCLVVNNRELSHGKFIMVSTIGMMIAGLFETAGYFAAEGIMYGNWAAAALGIPWNIAQFAFGMIVALVINEALTKTPAGKYFAIRENNAII